MIKNNGVTLDFLQSEEGYKKGYKVLNYHHLMKSKLWIVCLVFLVTLSACSDGDKKNSPPPNRVPTASAGSDSTVAEFSTVTLDGSASSDPDANTLTYAWTQTAGSPALTITNATLSQATFAAPDVMLGTPQQFTFQLTVNDGNGATASDSVIVEVQEPGPDVIISGTLQYQFVPPNNNCQGLAYPSTQVRPIRGATVQILNAANNQLIATTVASALGEYSLTLPSQLEVYLRIRAELKQTGTPSWDVEVRDNTSNIASPLNLRPLYVLDSAIFNTGIVDDSARDLLAETGWDGFNSYASTRAAAPFSILDTIYDGIQLVLSADPGAQFPPLDAFWSVNNSNTAGDADRATNIDNGELGSSFYSPDLDSLFLLGKADNDTEEFDDHVIAHEWGHYFEDNFSRSDSFGGVHSLGNRLDMRVAFGEGFGTAIAGMATGSPQYCDTGGVAQGQGFGINIENQSPGFGTEGWFNEITITRLLYDLWDTNIDGADTDSLGFGPIFDVMTNDQKNTVAFTSIFSFMTALKADTLVNNPAKIAFIDALLTERNITTNLDIYGSNETNDAENLTNSVDVLPVYTNMVPDGSVINACSNSQYDNARDGNKLSERQLFRLEIPISGNYQFQVTNSDLDAEIPPVGFNCKDLALADPTDPNVHRYSDPDFFVYRGGTIVAGGTECKPNEEPAATFPLASGVYAMSLLEFRYVDEATVSGYPERRCFNVSVTPVP